MGVGRYGEGLRAPARPARADLLLDDLHARPIHLEGSGDRRHERSRNGFITVTPLHFDLTRHDLLPEVGRWDWNGGPTAPDRPAKE